MTLKKLLADSRAMPKPSTSKGSVGQPMPRREAHVCATEPNFSGLRWEADASPLAESRLEPRWPPLNDEEIDVRRRLDSLDALNRRARDDAFGIDDLDWSLAVDHAKPWEPEELGSLWFVPSFAALDAVQRRRCNQLHALGVCEQFVWFEHHLIRAIGNVLRGARLPAPLDEALRHFISEEQKHIAMFWRLLEKSEPGWYRVRSPRLFRASPLHQFMMDRVAANPRTLIAWVWLAILVEERTLFISRLHLQAAKRAPGQIDALHAQVHGFHFRDEARHYRLDQHLLTWLYDPQPQWKKKLSAFMFRQVMRSFVGARRTAVRILAQLGREFPALRADVLPRIFAELREVGRNPRYHLKHFSRAAQPHTLALLAEYPEHDRLWELLPAAQRRTA